MEPRKQFTLHQTGATPSLLAQLKPQIYPQGSFRIGTTGRPLVRQEYDLDLVCEFQLNWMSIPNPVVLLNAVEARLQESELHRRKLERKNRCIRVKYANEFHLDILPACPDPFSGPECVVVPDREAREWKPSNPKGYAKWFESRAQSAVIRLAEKVEPLPGQDLIEAKPPLKRAVQLMKRWRGVAYANRQDVAPISIVLTTLGGLHYRGERSVNEALRNILDGIVASLPQRGERLMVLNPTNPKEDLSERWDDKPESYQAFVSGILAFQRAWRDLNGTRGISEVCAALSRLFGEDPTKTAVREQALIVQRLRGDRQLGVKKGSGLLASGSSTAAIVVPPNIFHGS